jgi:hypothetical protein
MDHPQVGELELGLSKLAIEGTDGLMLVVHHAEPGTTSAERLALLASLVAEGQPSRSTARVARSRSPEASTGVTSP